MWMRQFKPKQEIKKVPTNVIAENSFPSLMEGTLNIKQEIRGKKIIRSPSPPLEELPTRSEIVCMQCGQEVREGTTVKALFLIKRCGHIICNKCFMPSILGAKRTNTCYTACPVPNCFTTIGRNDFVVAYPTPFDKLVQTIEEFQIECVTKQSAKEIQTSELFYDRCADDLSLGRILQKQFNVDFVEAHFKCTDCLCIPLRPWFTTCGCVFCTKCMKYKIMRDMQSNNNTFIMCQRCGIPLQKQDIIDTGRIKDAKIREGIAHYLAVQNKIQVKCINNLELMDLEGSQKPIYKALVNHNFTCEWSGSIGQYLEHRKTCTLPV